MKKFLANVSLLLGLTLFVVAVNYAVINWDMMYLEQPIIYQANQSIHSFTDLLHVYLHPKLLDIYIPFFRPSGHFLMYQLITPILGWHNTKGLLVINLIFLALIGFVMIKLYELLFPGYKAGGYIAFALYLMQPALMMSRVTIMHFEFAYVFFVMLSCYCFVLFCQKNTLKQFQRFNLFGLAMLFNVIAITFKEPALLLGPVLFSYLVIYYYNGEKFLSYARKLITNKVILSLMLLLAITTVLMTIYLISPWQGLSNPWRVQPTSQQMLASAKEFFFVLINATHYFQPQGLFNPTLVWRNNITPLMSSLAVWIALFLTIASIMWIIISKSVGLAADYKKSLLFLAVACGMFLALPIAWAMGFPWHASLSLVFFSVMLGFGVEFFFQTFINKKWSYAINLMLAVGIGLTTLSVNNANINSISASWEYLYYTLNRNAIFNPPPIKDQLNANSVIVVEDNNHQGEYYFGDSKYPAALQSEQFDYKNLQKTLPNLAIKYDAIYNGNLFHWAYLMPHLKEELYPFQVQQMQSVPDSVIANWLQHYNNIFCLGYDDSFNWQDRTAIFKKNLLIERDRRHLSALG